MAFLGIDTLSRGSDGSVLPALLPMLPPPPLMLMLRSMLLLLLPMLLLSPMLWAPTLLESAGEADRGSGVAPFLSILSWLTGLPLLGVPSESSSSSGR